jgi:hypothetical protein
VHDREDSGMLVSSVVCSIACIGGKKGKRGGCWDGRGFLRWGSQQLTLGKRVEIHNHSLIRLFDFCIDTYTTIPPVSRIVTTFFYIYKRHVY